METQLTKTFFGCHYFFLILKKDLMKRNITLDSDPIWAKILDPQHCDPDCVVITGNWDYDTCGCCEPCGHQPESFGLNLVSFLF